jgi:hypothetical protein
MSETLNNLIMAGTLVGKDGEPHPELVGACVNTSKHLQKNLKSSRKALPRPQSLHLKGIPKCLRFVEAVQATSRGSRHRKATSLEEGVVWSAGKLMTRRKDGRNSGEVLGEVDSEIISLATDVGGNVGEQTEPHPSAGNNSSPLAQVNWLLCENSLEDVESFIASKSDPGNIAKEAAELFEIQQDLGLNNVSNDVDIVQHLVDMEVRDQQKLNENEVAQNLQC